MKIDIFGRPKFVTHLTRQESLKRHIRKRILSGDLAPGEQLPAVHELAKYWDVNVRTVHLALRALVREGLLTSIPRVGIYVSNPEAKLTRVGIVYSQQLFAPHGSRLLHSLHRQLQNLLEEQGVEVSVWLDSRPQDQQNTPWEALQTAAHERRVQALIVPALTAQQMEWMEKLPVCTAYLSTALLPNTVHMNIMQFIDLSLDRLAGLGCRSVGFICPSPLHAKSPMEREQPALWMGHFVDRATDLGMEVRNEWMRLEEDGRCGHRVNEAFQTFGYREFHKLWAQLRRPEGLVVGDDVVMQGVSTSILELGVRVPGELRVVSSKNKYVEGLVPFPVHHVVMDERKIAKALIEQIQIQFRGDRCGVSPQWVDYTLES